MFPTKLPLCTFFLFFLAVGITLVQGNHRPAQPWPIIVDRYASCCDLMGQHVGVDSSLSRSELQSELAQLTPCVASLHRNQAQIQQHYGTHGDKTPSHRIAVITMSLNHTGSHHIPHIELFSSYQRLLVGAYCEHHQYQYYDFDAWAPSTSPDDHITLAEDIDIRWHKMLLLQEALHPVHGWARHTDAIVWVDSDAIVLDFALSIEDLLQQHPKADLIVSADIKLGLINTGFMILRNTHWMRQILQRWYSISDRSTVCDQDAFDTLYFQLQHEAEEERDSIQQKVKILPTDALNSHPPAWKFQRPTSQILHLMGETAVFRAGVFRKGYTAVCAARSGGFLSPQLSIYPETMITLAQQIYKDETQRAFIQANTTHSIDDIESLFLASHHYVDVLQHLGATQYFHKASLKQQLSTEVVRIREAVLKLTLHAVEVAKQQVTSLSQMLEQYHANPRNNTENGNIAQVEELFADLVRRRSAQYQAIVSLQKKAAEAGNALYQVIQDLEDHKNIATLVFDVLIELEQGLVEESRDVARHMRALMHQNLAMSYYATATKLSTQDAKLRDKIRGYLTQALAQATLSVSIFEQYFRDTKDGSVMLEHLQSLQLQAGTSCMLTQYFEAVQYWQETIAKARQSTRGLTMGIHYERLAVVLYNAAICFLDAQDQMQGLEYATEAKEILLQLIQDKSSKLPGKHQEEDAQQVSEWKELLQMVDVFLKQAEVTMADSRSHLLHRRARQESHTTSEETPSEATVEGGKEEGEATLPSMKRVQDRDGKVKYVYEGTEGGGSSAGGNTVDNNVGANGEGEDDYEWEECSELEEGCDSFLVYDEVTPPSTSTATVSTASAAGTTSSTAEKKKKDSPNLFDPQLYEGMDDEDIMELMEVRRRHSHVSGVEVLEDVVKKESTGSECQSQEVALERLREEVRQLQTQNTVLQGKLDKIKKAFDLN